MLRRFLFWLTAPFAAAVLPPADGAQPPGQILTTGHLDLEFQYDGSWQAVVDHDAFPDLDAAQAVLTALDRPFPAEGNRVARPADPQWDFLGVSAGEPLWLFPQATTDRLWPGWASVGAFAEYYEADPRVGFAAPFVKLRLDAVRYEGTGTGHFALWTNQTGGGLTVWMTSTDGITDDDAFYFSSGHAHTNFGFSHLGVYQLDLEAGAFLDNDGGIPPAGANRVTSALETFTFAIGTFAEWKARFYGPDDLVDQDSEDDLPAVSHPLSDTDGDGVPLLLEYAFGLSPVVAGRPRFVAAESVFGLPAVRLRSDGEVPCLILSYPRRRSDRRPQITYHPEFSSDPTRGWEEAGHQSVASLNDDWEVVEVVEPLGTDPETSRFARVRVILE